MNQNKLVEALENRIKELNAADVEFCKDRWEGDRYREVSEMFQIYKQQNL